MTKIPKSNSKLKNILQASALVAEGFSKNSAGNVASTIVESGLDFSGSGGKKKNGEGVKGKTKDINPADEQNTENAAGKKTSKTTYIDKDAS